MTPALRRTAVLTAAVLPAPAFAHGTVPGIQGFYTGVLHPFSTSAQVLLLPLLALLIGGLAFRWMSRALGVFATGTLLGVLAGLLTGILPDDTALFAVAICAGALAALTPGRLPALTLLPAAFGGVLIGMESVPDPGPLGARIVMITGALLGANIAVFYMSMGVNGALVKFDRPWVRIGFRIGAAWLTAISMVMLAMRYAPQPA